MSDLLRFRQRKTDASLASSTGVAPVPLPAGTVTFLLTDIEGSTRTWEDHGDEMAAAVVRHYEILDAAIAGHQGVRPVEQGEGDSLVAAFTRASDAAATALEAQLALRSEGWPEGMAMPVRMALHTGEAQLRQERYYIGPTIIRCARLRALAHGGQVLVSGSTGDLLTGDLPEGATLVHLGIHRLRDLRQPERVFQLSHSMLPSAFPPLRSLDALPNNLPVQLTGFIGREAELGELETLAGEHRLVSLVGAGGVGKTRLAAQLGAEVAESHPDGVWWVELAQVGDPDLVPRAVLGALGIGDDRGFEPLDRISAYLGGTRTLLVLDNCEHLLAAVAQMIDALLRACPHLSIVATSREPLGVPGEVVWRVPPLSLPGETAGTEDPCDLLLGSEAVRLFVDRALEARPAFRADAGNAATLAAICAHLDGLPLAIELAAARVRSLSPERILGGLADRFRLLTGGARTAVARQQTLQASVEWSYDLLSHSERVLFRRLATFSGGFTLESAEAVCAGEGLEAFEVLGLLTGLVDKSLVVFDGDRYRLLQIIHGFANTQLLVSGEANAVRDRHAMHFLGMAECAAALLEREVRLELVAALEADHDNLRTSLEWSAAENDHEQLVRLVVALALFWLAHGHFSEGLSWHRRILASLPTGPSPPRCRAVWGLGHLSLTCMEVSNGLGLADVEEAVALARALADPCLLARPLADQGLTQVFLDPDVAPATLRQALDAARAAGDEWAASLAMWWQAFYWVFVRDRFERAEPLLGELEAIGQRAGNLDCLAWNDIVVGMAAWRRGRLSDARAAMERARAGAKACADPLLEMHAVEWQTELRIAQGDYAGASSLALETAARLSRTLDGCRQGFIEFGLAEVALARGDLAEAERQANRLGPVIEGVGIPFKVEKLALLRGRLALAVGDHAGARCALDVASDIAARSGTPWMQVEVHAAFALLASAEGDRVAAEDRNHAALALEVEYGFRGMAADTLEALGSLALAVDSGAEAVRLLGAASGLRHATGQTRWALYEDSYQTDIVALRAALGAETFAELWEEGMTLELDTVASYASRARGERKRPRSGWAALTPTELEVAALAAQGLTNAEIGRRLFISAGTARNHLSHIYEKLGIANRAQLASRATARGIAE